jgi:hypothetical protein
MMTVVGSGGVIINRVRVTKSFERDFQSKQKPGDGGVTKIDRPKPPARSAIREDQKQIHDPCHR